MITLDAIKEDFKTNKERFTDMLKQWLYMKPTWESLIAALREETVGLTDVADKVEKEYEKLKNSATAHSGGISRLILWCIFGGCIIVLFFIM